MLVVLVGLVVWALGMPPIPARSGIVMCRALPPVVLVAMPLVAVSVVLAAMAC